MKIDFESFKHKYHRPPRNQFPAGARVYKGFQGDGKTLSLIHDFFELIEQFPDCKKFGNVKLTGVPGYQIIESDDDLNRALMCANGAQGVVIVLDEAQLFFSKRNGISFESLTAICQNRKDRRRILMTSQIWEDLDIPLRKQVDEVVKCRNYLGFIQFNQVFNGRTLRWSKQDNDWVADKKYSYIYKHNQDLYDRYDTFQKIIPNNELQVRYGSTAPANREVTVKLRGRR